jgi:hypothetical protein
MSQGKVLTPYAALVLQGGRDRLALGGFRTRRRRRWRRWSFSISPGPGFSQRSPQRPGHPHTVRWLKENSRPDRPVLPDQRFHPYVQQ